eukprot:18479-Heterococcus_DN1.PRE.2
MGAARTQHVVYERSSFEPGNAVLAWRRGIDGTNRFAASTQGSTTLRNALGNQNTAARVDAARLRMAHVGDMQRSLQGSSAGVLSDG